MKFLYFSIGVLLVTLIIFLIVYFVCPYKFPYKKISFNISSKRKPEMLDYIDNYLINHKNIEIMQTMVDLEQWKLNCNEKISKSIFKKHRYKQYKKCLDEDNLFKFIFFRMKTRYRQENYVRYPYQVKEISQIFSTSYEFLNDRFLKLKDINFEYTLNEYNISNQRKLMTKELRNQIALRDNFTCQKCGKYMPDGVGLHIDHIVPISKGGKSVISNLQVLCSKCNGSKSNR